MLPDFPKARPIFSAGEPFDGLRKLAETFSAFRSLDQLFLEQQERIAEVAKAFRSPGEVLLGQQERIVESLAAFDRAIQSRYPQLEAACDRLALLGWTMPTRFSVLDFVSSSGAFVSFADASRTDQDIDAMLTAFYSDSDCKQLRAVERDLTTSSTLGTRKLLLEEAFEAFYRGRHQIPVPALVATIEGLIATETGNLQSRSVAVKAFVAAREALAKPRTLECLTWYSVRKWIEQLFASSDFSGPLPPRINRHWILHGRDTGPWNMADSVRLFAALHTMV